MSTFFKNRLLEWHHKINDRQMPWKGIKDPYKIWLSEIILQQTRVQQGLKYYEKFITKFPTIQLLAHAKEQTVFKMWEGLGYYNRCKNLLSTAQEVDQKYKGIFPKTYEEVIALKGIGKYTAAAIMSFAYNEPYPVIDGNVYRVLSRFFGIDTPIDTKEGVALFEKIAHDCLSKQQPGLYNQAIMDLGATICKPQLALCNSCPLAKKCKAFQYNKVYELPVKSKKIIIRKRNFLYFIFHYKGKLGIQKRQAKDVWQNLYEFAFYETDLSLNHPPIVFEKIVKEQWKIDEFKIGKMSAIYDQKLTHQHIKARFVHVLLTKMPRLKLLNWVTTQELQNYPFPVVIHDFMKKEKKGFIFEK